MKLLTSQELETEFLDQLINRGKLEETRVFDIVKKIVNDVKNDGDRSLNRYTSEFDKINLESSELKVSAEAIQDAYEKIKDHELNVLKKAAKNIIRFHKKQVEREWFFEPLEGVVVGQTPRPLESVGETVRFPFKLKPPFRSCIWLKQTELYRYFVLIFSS